MNKQNITNFAVKIIGALLLTALCFNSSFALAVSSTDLQKQSESLSAQAAKLRAQALQKQAAAEQLKTQITSVQNEISQTESALNYTDGQILSTNKSIADLESKIVTEEDNLTKERDKLSKVISSWYMEGESGLFESMISSSSLSDVVTNQQYYDSMRQQIETSMDNIEKIKTDLKNQKSDKESKLADLNDLKSTQSDQKQYLSDKQTMKSRLLSDATSAVKDLTTQAAQAEAKAAEIRRVLASIYSSGSGTPKGSNLVSSIDYSWYYNQRDYGTVMSPSRLTIAEVGCLITSYAMVATHLSHRITPPEVVSASSFSTSGSWLWFNSSIGVSFNSKVPINWNVVNDQLARGIPVVVSVRIPGTNYDYNGDGSNHWIVIKGISGGKYVIHDPYWTNSSYSLSDVKSMKIVK